MFASLFSVSCVHTLNGGGLLLVTWGKYLIDSGWVGYGADYCIFSLADASYELIHRGGREDEVLIYLNS